MSFFDPIPYCRNTVKFAKNFGMEFTYSPKDIPGLEKILSVVNNDYKNNKIPEEKAEQIAIALGIYLGEVMLRAGLARSGYSWLLKNDEVSLAKGEADQMFPITKVWRRIVHGPEENIRTFYILGMGIADGSIEVETE